MLRLLNVETSTQGVSAVTRHSLFKVAYVSTLGFHVADPARGNEDS